MTTPTRPTALTEGELIHVENLEKVVHEQGVWAWWARESLAIIRRLDARALEPRTRVTVLGTTRLDCKDASHTTVVCGECTTRERDALPNARVRELEQRNQRLQETLALYEGPHVTMSVSYANELEKAERERDALLAALDPLFAALDREVPGWREV